MEKIRIEPTHPSQVHQLSFLADPQDPTSQAIVDRANARIKPTVVQTDWSSQFTCASPMVLRVIAGSFTLKTQQDPAYDEDVVVRTAGVAAVPAQPEPLAYKSEKCVALAFLVPDGRIERISYRWLQYQRGMVNVLHLVGLSSGREVSFWAVELGDSQETAHYQLNSSKAAAIVLVSGGRGTAQDLVTGEKEEVSKFDLIRFPYGHGFSLQPPLGSTLCCEILCAPVTDDAADNWAQVHYHQEPVTPLEVRTGQPVEAELPLLVAGAGK